MTRKLEPPGTVCIPAHDDVFGCRCDTSCGQLCCARTWHSMENWRTSLRRLREFSLLLLQRFRGQLPAECHWRRNRLEAASQTTPLPDQHRRLVPRQLLPRSVEGLPFPGQESIASLSAFLSAEQLCVGPFNMPVLPKPRYCSAALYDWAFVSH